MIADKCGDVTYEHDLGFPVVRLGAVRAWSTPDEAEHLYDCLRVFGFSPETPGLMRAEKAAEKAADALTRAGEALLVAQRNMEHAHEEYNNAVAAVIGLARQSLVAER